MPSPTRKIGLFLCLFLFFSPVLLAADITVVLEQSDITAWSGGSDTDPRGLAVLSDGRLVFFEDDYSPPSSKEDCILLIDPTQTGTARFTQIASESEILGLVSTTGKYAFVADIVRDASDNVYALATQYGSTNKNNFVLRIPYNQTTETFDNPELVVTLYTGGMSSSKSYHRLDVQGNTLFVYFDALNETSSNNGVYSFDLSGTLPGTTGDLTQLATFSDLGTALNGSYTNGDALGLWQIRADDQGDVFGFVYENDAGSPGDLIKIDGSTGTVTIHLSQDQSEKETGWKNAFNYETNFAISPVNGNFFFFETESSNKEREIIYEFTAAGKFVKQVSAYHEIKAAGGSAVADSCTTISSNAMDIDDSGNIHVFLSHNSAESLVTVEPTACNDTTSYHWPTGGTTPPDVASPYGPRQLASGNYRYDFHRGLDMAMSVGTAVYAVADGVVAEIDSDTNLDCNGSSLTEWKLKIRHGDCPPYVYATYLHLDSINSLSEGDSVTQGDKVGESGMSRSCYQHLHFELREGGTYQAVCRNPLERMPYTDTGAPTGPTLVGANQTVDETLLYFTFTTPDTELDLNAIEVDWGSDQVRWDWQVANKANGPSFPEGMDRPVIDLATGIYGVGLPEHMNAASTQADYAFAVAGLDPAANSGSAAIEDVNAAQGSTTMNLTGLPDLTITPASGDYAGVVGGDVDISFTVANPSISSQNVTLDIISAKNNTVTIDPADESFTLTAGASRAITITITLGSHPVTIGDGIVVLADVGGTLDVIGVYDIQTTE